MKVSILAVDKLARSPETELVGLYVKRATAAGRALGLGPVELIEVEARKPGKAAEAQALASHFSDSHVIACDERGKARSSRAFAEEITILRDRGVRRLVLAIGGTDGLDPALVSRAQGTLAFGPQTWPHALARVMLTEQIYRSFSILAGLPYHRE